MFEIFFWMNETRSSRQKSGLRKQKSWKCYFFITGPIVSIVFRTILRFLSFYYVTRERHVWNVCFPTTVGGVPGCGRGSGSCCCGRRRSTTSADTGARQWDQPRRWSGGRVGTCHLGRDDTGNSDTRHRSQRSTKAFTCQQHTLPFPRPWPQGNVRGKSISFFLFILQTVFIRGYVSRYNRETYKLRLLFYFLLFFCFLSSWDT